MYLTSPCVQLILAYILEESKGGGRNGFISSVSSLSFIFFSPLSLLDLLYYLSSPFLWETTQNDPQGLTCR